MLQSHKHQIIRKPADFNRLFRAGKRYSSSSFSLIVSDSSQTRFGVAVSRKITSAVKRNKARRKTKEILRLNQEVFPERKEFIVLAKPVVVTIRTNILAEELLELLQAAQK